MKVKNKFRISEKIKNNLHIIGSFLGIGLIILTGITLGLIQIAELGGLK